MLVFDGFDEPLLIAAGLKLEEREPQFFHRREGPHPAQRLIERADESLDAPVAFRRPHERRTGRDPENPQFVREHIAQVLAVVIVPQRDARGGVGLVRAEDPSDRVPDQLECFEPRPP